MIKTIIMIMTVFIAGCFPLAQMDKISSSGMSASYDNGDDYVLIAFPSDFYKVNPEIIDELSYAIDPDGNKYKIKHVKHQFDIDQRHNIVRDDVYLLGKNGKAISSLKNGVWKLTVITKDMNNSNREWNIEFKLWTFYYSPFIHGAPN